MLTFECPKNALKALVSIVFICSPQVGTSVVIFPKDYKYTTGKLSLD
jgi:hypothetical protein